MNSDSLFSVDIMLLIIRHLPIGKQFQCQFLSRKFRRELAFEKWSRHALWKGNFPYVFYILLKYRHLFLDETNSWNQGGSGWYGCEYVTLDLLLMEPRIAQMDMRALAANRSITLDDMDRYPNLPWSFYAWTMLQNPSIPPAEVFRRYPDQLDRTQWTQGYALNPNADEFFLDYFIEKEPWNAWDLHLHPRVTVEFIERHPTYTWNFAELSRNPNLTFEFILKHKDNAWSWDSLSQHKCVSWENYLEHNYLPWSSMHIYDNPNVPLNVFLEKRNSDGYNDGNPLVTPAVLDAHPEIGWNYFWVSRSPSIPWAYVVRNMDKPWCWHMLSTIQRPNE